MKYVENSSGISNDCLDRGFDYTGDIAKVGDNVFKPESVAHEKMEAEMAKKYGWSVEEEKGGFLERNNYDDRM